MVALLTQSASSIALRESSHSESSIWAEIEEAANHKHHEKHHHKHDKSQDKEDDKPKEDSKEAKEIKD